MYQLISHYLPVVTYRGPSTVFPPTNLLGVCAPIGELAVSTLVTFDMEGDEKSGLRFAEALFGVRPWETFGVNPSKLVTSVSYLR